MKCKVKFPECTTCQQCLFLQKCQDHSQRNSLREKILTKNYLVNVLSPFQCENAESLPDLFQKIIRSSQCQCILSTHIVSGNRNLNAVISALCISHCEILQNVFWRPQWYCGYHLHAFK